MIGGPTGSGRRLLAMLAAGLMVAATGAQAQETYPNRVVRIVVGVDPGGPSDLITRVFAQELTARMGQNFIVENRGGAGGAIGLQRLAAAAGDGYTLGWGSFSSLVLRPAINISAVPFDPEKELTPISVMAEQAFVLAVSPSLRAPDLKTLVAVLKSSPGKYNFGSPGPGGLPHLLFELMNKNAGVQIEHVPYKGDAASFQALVAGDVHLLLTAPNLYGSLADNVPLLAIAAPRRSAQYPDVPTFDEAGLPGLGYTAWHALFAPTGVPPAIADQIDRAVRQAAASSKTQAALKAMGMTPATMQREDFAASYTQARRHWSQVIPELKLDIVN